MPIEFNASCPIPIQRYPHVLLAHGGGGSLMQHLIGDLFLKAFDNPVLRQGHDSALLSVPTSKLAFTTDSYVIHPRFFPGGDIGSLAIHGTVNDLAMSGAKPLYISVGFILEEGLSIEELWKVSCSMRNAADAAGVSIATGDTKVVDRGKGDGVYINTAGIGVVEHELSISPRSIQPGDSIVVSGDIGRHGIAIMAVRSGLEFETAIESDSAPVHHKVLSLLNDGLEIHCLRDITRGGLASVLNELASASGYSMEIEEASVPVRDDVAAACEMLGFDPLYVACEGRFVAIVPSSQIEPTRAILGEDSRFIGHVSESGSPLVTMKSRIGTKRIVSLLSGEQLPRIC